MSAYFSHFDLPHAASAMAATMTHPSFDMTSLYTIRYTYEVPDHPLAKPEHLRDVRGDWLARHAAGVAALALGALALVAVLIAQDRLFADPDWRIAVPGFAATTIAAAISLARRERAYMLWPIGLGLAACALLVGWVVMLAIVVGATAVVVYILHHVL
jgi:hypothetical protein